MINTDFLKKLTILYVEDEDIAREQLGKSLRRLFKNVILASNGEDGYNKFHEERLAGRAIDLILSDISMPKLNGLEMLEKIREIDENVPVMYTTARTEIEYIQKAIELNVHHYALKPINLDDIIMRIQKVCEKQYFQMIIDSKNSELKNYLSVINNVAAIFRINEKGEITFINDLLCELFNQEESSLLGKSFTSLFHNDVAKTTSEQIWSKISNDETWNGDIKFKNNEDEPFFIRSSIFKLMRDDSLEYISIGFISTKEIEKQREFHKNVLLSITSKNKEAYKSKNELEAMSVENNKLKEKVNKIGSETKIINDQLLLLKKKNI